MLMWVLLSKLCSQYSMIFRLAFRRSSASLSVSDIFSWASNATDSGGQRQFLEKPPLPRVLLVRSDLHSVLILSVCLA